MESLGERMKNFRAKYNLTQEELARKMTVTASYISKLERGELKGTRRRTRLLFEKVEQEMLHSQMAVAPGPANAHLAAASVDTALWHLKQAELILQNHGQSRSYRLGYERELGMDDITISVGTDGQDDGKAIGLSGEFGRLPGGRQLPLDIVSLLEGGDDDRKGFVSMGTETMVGSQCEYSHSIRQAARDLCGAGAVRHQRLHDPSRLDGEAQGYSNRMQAGGGDR
jgi:transcriptional regulator with XRE-family HTH domain